MQVKYTSHCPAYAKELGRRNILSLYCQKHKMSLYAVSLPLPTRLPPFLSVGFKAVLKKLVVT